MLSIASASMGPRGRSNTYGQRDNYPTLIYLFIIYSQDFFLVAWNNVNKICLKTQTSAYHPEVPTSRFTQPLWQPPPPPKLSGCNAVALGRLLC